MHGLGLASGREDRGRRAHAQLILLGRLSLEEGWGDLLLDELPIENFLEECLCRWEMLASAFIRF